MHLQLYKTHPLQQQLAHPVGDVFYKTLDTAVYRVKDCDLDNCLPLAINNAAGTPIYE